MNPSEECDRIEDFVRTAIQSAKCEGAVVGLSGGIDSAVVACLTKRALGNNRLLCMTLPFGVQTTTADAAKVAEHLGVPLGIYDLHSALIAFPMGSGRIPLGNLMARLRMCALYACANSRNYMVIGTGNRSELLMGYFTKYGDGGVDLLPIGHLYKTEVRALARSLGLPQWLIEASPTAGLWEGQTDEEEMGITYEELDRVLPGTVGGEPPETVATKTGVAVEKVRMVADRVSITTHKRQMPSHP